MERTLVILKPSAVQRGLIGRILNRFEEKGFIIAGLKMMQLTEQILDEHYAHLVNKSFYPRIRKSMMSSPVVLCCLEGVNAIRVIHSIAGVTNGREAAPGTIRGDFSLSIQENVIHTSDSPKTATEEIERFFSPEELFTYKLSCFSFLYSEEEVCTQVPKE